MAKKKGSKEKLVEETEEEQKKSVILLTSSDDDEANEDLSLQIVEKARLREAKRKREKDFDDGVRLIEGVIDLSSSSCEEVKEFANRSRCETSGDVVKEEEKKKKKRKKKKKKKSKQIEQGEENKSVGVVDSEEPMGTITSVETEPGGGVETEELGGVETEELGDTVKAVETEAVEILDNVVLRRLLRGPRYFDPPGRSCKTCYNCGEEGHNAVNCTSKRRKKPCFICGSLDHGVRNCSQGQDCFICKKQGHRAKDCPDKYQANSQDAKICLRCGDLGHLMSYCSRDYDPEDLKEIQCYVCKRPGHLCCVDSINPGPAEVSCYTCGQSGHTGTACAKQRGEVSGSVPATLCYKCGEEGHFARGCTNHSKPDRWMGESSTPTHKYSKKVKDSLGFRSAPPVGKIHKKKSTQYEERDIATEGRSKRRGGWITDDPGDLPNRKSKDKGWWSPATPAQNVSKISARTFGSHPSNSRPPWMPSNPYPGTPKFARNIGSHPSNPQPQWTPPNPNYMLPNSARTPGSHPSNSSWRPYPMPPNPHGSPYPPPLTPTYNSSYPHRPTTPSSHVYPKPYPHTYRAPGFGNSIGSGGRNNYW